MQDPEHDLDRKRHHHPNQSHPVSNTCAADSRGDRGGGGYLIKLLFLLSITKNVNGQPWTFFFIDNKKKKLYV